VTRAGSGLRYRRERLSFRDRYGPWALVAGASEGIGAAFATELARRGLDVVLVARRQQPLDALAATLPTASRTVAVDLSTMDGLNALVAATAGLDVGLVVANAAYSPIGAFVDQDPAQLTRVLDLNCRAPMLLARWYAPAMATRGRGGLVIMSSLSGLQGTGTIAAYAASKAFDRVLAEGLWAELRPAGVDVVTCVAGAVATPGYERAMSHPGSPEREAQRSVRTSDPPNQPAGSPEREARRSAQTTDPVAGPSGKAARAPGTVTAAVVVDAALRALGRRPTVVPGALMRFSAPLMSRVLPRRTAIATISRATARLSGTPTSDG
jgi:short-subunit dehydrogenase